MTPQLPTDDVFEYIAANEPIAHRVVTERFDRGDDAVWQLMRDGRVKCTHDFDLVTTKGDGDE